MDDDNRADEYLDPEVQDEGSSETQGPRRSTWAPPLSSPGDTGADTSDDDLARALEAEFERVTHFEVSQEPEIATEPSTESEPEFVRERPQEPEPEFVSEPEPEPMPEPEPEPEPTIVYALDDVPLTEEYPEFAKNEPPVRRSIPTSELAATLAERVESGGDSIELMAQLEDQLRLQEQDVADFRQWQEAMVENGGQAALEEVESAREEFGDILDTAPSAQPQVPEQEDGPELVTHTFRVDEVLDSDLLSAPAPVTAPVSDIPPPSDHVSMPTPSMSTSAPPRIPDLVEPAEMTGPADPFDFDSLIDGDLPHAEEAPTVFSMEGTAQSPADADTESIRDEDVSDIDQMLTSLAGPFPVTSEGVAVLPAAPVAPFEPVSSAQVSSGEFSSVGSPIAEVNPTAPPAFRVEENSGQPTPTDQRVGRASRLFWLWFAANSSIVSVAFGGAVLSLGMSLRQAIVATLIGVAVSFLPLGLGTLAGKWSGQPTMMVSRATFGHLGNIVPSVLAIIVRLFWGAVFLWFLAAGTARILAGAELTGPLTEVQVMIIGLAAGFLLALVIAFFGYGLISRVQLIFTIISALLIVGLVFITWPAVDIPTALTVGDGPWILVVTGAVLVFSFVGLAWAVSSADLARYQRASGSGAASMLWSTFGATIPAFALIAYGSLLAASNPDVATGLLETPLDTIALLIPIWYPVPLIAALAFSLLSGIVISIYSGAFALQTAGASMRRSAAVVVFGAGVAVIAGLIAFTVGDFALVLRDVATTLAVPIAAWAGIFGAEMMIRSKGFDAQGLLKRGGVYADFHWVNFAMLIVASAIGFGLTTASVVWLEWQGYLYGIMGVPLSSDLAASDLGVFVALIIGILTPIVAGIPVIRRQESADTQRSAVAAK